MSGETTRRIVFTVTVFAEEYKPNVYHTNDMVQGEFGAILADGVANARHIRGYRIERMKIMRLGGTMKRRKRGD